MLDDQGNKLMIETQRWSMHIVDGQYIIDQEWFGDAVEEVVINEFGYGGMFLRMPWQEGMPAQVVNASRQKNQAAEGQKSIWLDVAMQVKGREDKVHVAILDHPNNAGSPTAWRVDHQFGVGPSRGINGDWQIAKGTTELIQHRLVVSLRARSMALSSQNIGYNGVEMRILMQHSFGIWRERKPTKKSF